jgi:uncharacterized protein YjdB
MTSPRATWIQWAVALSAAATAAAACGGDDALDPNAGTVATVEVAPATATVIVGGTVSLTAAVRDVAGNVLTGRRVVWVSADSNFATVSASGVVTGRYVGTVPVAAAVEGKSATAEVIVVPRPVATVRLSPTSRDLTVGESAQLTAEPLDVTGAVLSGRPVTWTTSRPSVASVNGSGVVTALAPGSAVISATVEGKSGVAAVTVSPAAVASVVVRPSSATLGIGQALAFEAEPRSASGQPLPGREVVWSSNSSQVATVASTGVVIAIAPGTATITATSEGRSGTAQVTVLPPTVQRVEVTPASAVIDEKGSFRLTATVYDSRGTVLIGQDVTWTSSDTRVATVDDNGRVRGERTGTVTITATSGGVSGTAQVRVRED